MTKGQSLINYQATHAHGGNSFGPSMQTKIDVFSAQWSAGLNTYNQCLSNSSLQTVNSSFGNFTTIGKTVPTINATNFVDLSFDLDSDILTAGEKYPAILKVKVKYLTYAGINTGFIFKEPSIQLKSTTTESYQIGDIRFIVDSQPQNFVTTYIDTLLTVSGTVVTPIAPGYAAAAAYYVSPGTATKISLDVRKMGLYKPK